MIDGAGQGTFDRLAQVLERSAQALGEARAAALAARRRAPDSVWRQASLLWPLFTKG